MDRKEKLKNLMRQRKAERSAAQRRTSDTRLSVPIGTSSHTKRHRIQEPAHEMSSIEGYAHQSGNVQAPPKEYASFHHLSSTFFAKKKKKKKTFFG
jgi:hypothetical protein